MTTWYRRMIYYEPVDDCVDLQYGRLHYHGDGVLTIAYGQIRLLVSSFLVADVGGRRIRRSTTDAVLLPALDQDMTAMDADTIDPEVPVITPPGLVDMIELSGFRNIHHLDAWHQIVLRRGDASITITALPVDTLPDRDALAMGSLLEFRPSPGAAPVRACLCNGPASIGLMDDIAARYPSIDFAVVRLNCRRLGDAVVGFDTERAAEFVHRVQPELTIPIHRFDDVFTWPIRDFQRELIQAGSGSCVRAIAPGTSHVFPVGSCDAAAVTARQDEGSSVRGEFATIAGS
jgi:hypothetical protein